MRLTTGQIISLAESAERVHANLLNLSAEGFNLKSAGKFGGCLRLADTTGQFYLTAPVGSVQEGKWPKYYEFAGEKITRLVSHQPDGHVLSRQSRDPQKDQWGGAVRFNYSGDHHYLSFSGLPELIDEVLVFGTLIRERVMSMLDVERMLEVLPNEKLSLLNYR